MGPSTGSPSASSPPAPSRRGRWGWRRAGRPKNLTPPSKEFLQGRLVPVSVPVTSLVRMSKRPAREPFWSQSKRYRFDDPQGRFGVLYAGDSIETSFAESVIHERAVFLNDRCVIEQKDFLARQPVWYVCAKSHLRLAELTGTNLKALGP